MSEVTVTFQATPNPNAGKFVVSRRVVEGSGSKSFYSVQQAADDPVAGPLFKIPGVQNVFMADDFVTVTKLPSSDWQLLIPVITGVLRKSL